MRRLYGGSRYIQYSLSCIGTLHVAGCAHVTCCRKYLLIDPNATEERVMDGKMVIGMNKHRELVTLQLTGSVLLHKDQVQHSLWRIQQILLIGYLQQQQNYF